MHPLFLRININHFLSIITACGLAIFAGEAWADDALTVEVNHDRIGISSLYRGSTVSVRGTCGPDRDIIIRITSAAGQTALKKKGKVAGLLWMNTGELRFDHAPGLYFVRSTKKIDALLSRETAEQFVLGLPALKLRIGIEPITGEAEKDRWFAEFVRFKQRDRLYAEENSGITLRDRDGRRTYSTVFQWPYQARPGEYEVHVFAVKDRQILERARAGLLVERTGAVKYLATLAEHHGAMYGLVSILVALLSGFGAGMIFRRGGKGAH